MHKIRLINNNKKENIKILSVKMFYFFKKFFNFKEFIDLKEFCLKEEFNSKKVINKSILNKNAIQELIFLRYLCLIIMS